MTRNNDIRCLLLLLAGLISVDNAPAQSILSLQEIIPKIGTNYILHRTDFVSPGPNGPDVIWDMTALSIESSNGITVKEADASAYAELFPGADICLDYGGNDHVFLSTSGETYAHLGGVAKGTALVLEDPKELFRLPLTLGNIHTDAFSSSFKQGEVNIERNGRVDVKVVGSGSLIIADDLFTDVLKVRVVEIFVDRYKVVGYPQERLTVNETYYYLKSGLNDILLSLCTRFEDREVTLQYGVLLEYGSHQDQLKENLALEDLSVGPNPTINITTIQFRSDSTASYELTLLDINGKEVSAKQSLSALEGAMISEEISMASLSPGAYLLRVEMGDQSRLVKVVKE